jgi:hypothetical protein
MRSLVVVVRWLWALVSFSFLSLFFLSSDVLLNVFLFPLVALLFKLVNLFSISFQRPIRFLTWLFQRQEENTYLFLHPSNINVFNFPRKHRLSVIRLTPNTHEQVDHGILLIYRHHLPEKVGLFALFLLKIKAHFAG